MLQYIYITLFGTAGRETNLNDFFVNKKHRSSSNVFIKSMVVTLYVSMCVLILALTYTTLFYTTIIQTELVSARRSGSARPPPHLPALGAVAQLPQAQPPRASAALCCSCAAPERRHGGPALPIVYTPLPAFGAATAPCQLRARRSRWRRPPQPPARRAEAGPPRPRPAWRRSIAATGRETNLNFV